MTGDAGKDVTQVPEHLSRLLRSLLVRQSAGGGAGGVGGQGRGGRGGGGRGKGGLEVLASLRISVQ